MPRRAHVQMPILMLDCQLGSTARNRRNSEHELWLGENRQCEQVDLKQRVAVVVVVLRSKRAFLAELLDAQ